MRFERERKNGRRVRKKKGVAEERKCALGKTVPHSKGCWVFIYSGRGQSTFDYSTVTSRNPLQLLEHPRFLGGADERPPCCYGLRLVGSDVNAEDYKLYYKK